MRYFIPIFIILVVTAFSILGFRGERSKNTPIEVFPDMDRQAKYKPQTANEKYADKRADRLPVPGTAVRGNSLDLGNVFSSSPELMTHEFRTGKTETGEWVAKIPMETGIDMSLMRLGKERYDIHCAICHGEYGNGRGATVQFGLVPRNLSDPSQSGTYLENAAPWTDGQIYNAITKGSVSQIMLGLGDKLSPRERWAIVLYVRALQSYVGTATAIKKGKDS
ncbi:MAG: c-type cytochrome [Opitutae bacterium]|jgi:mono/diheme cytochrome c family protein|nr:c-type cytochrome [Opitutae bacterium]